MKVIDQCPDCAAGHIDLSETAFAALAPLSAGLISVSYSPLADPLLPGPVSVEVKQGSSQYWLALLADNTGNPLAAVQVRTSSGWLSLARASYDYWIASSGAGAGPFTVRLTDAEGHQVTVSGITLSPGTAQSTGTWMYGGGTTTTPSDSPPSLAATSAAPGASARAVGAGRGRYRRGVGDGSASPGGPPPRLAVAARKQRGDDAVADRAGAVQLLTCRPGAPLPRLVKSPSHGDVAPACRSCVLRAATGREAGR